VTLTVTNFSSNVQLSACLAPNNAPGQSIYGNAVAASMMNLEAVAGANRVVTAGAFQPLTVRVADSSSPPNSVLGANVGFLSIVMRPTGNNLSPPGTDPTNNQNGPPTILSESRLPGRAISMDWQAWFRRSIGPFTGQLLVEVQITTALADPLQEEVESFPAP
jgi:hypothetical protein